MGSCSGGPFGDCTAASGDGNSFGKVRPVSAWIVIYDIEITLRRTKRKNITHAPHATRSQGVNTCFSLQSQLSQASKHSRTHPVHTDKSTYPSDPLHLGDAFQPPLHLGPLPPHQTQQHLVYGVSVSATWTAFEVALFPPPRCHPGEPKAVDVREANVVAASGHPSAASGPPQPSHQNPSTQPSSGQKQSRMVACNQV